MNQSNLLEQAQQGEPSAIAALMNAALEPKGVTAKVDLEGDCLYVMFESTQSLNPDTLMRFTHRGLQELETGLVKRVKLYEQKIGENTISWKREFAIGVPLEIAAALLHESPPIGEDAADAETLTAKEKLTIPPQLEVEGWIDQVKIDQVARQTGAESGEPHQVDVEVNPVEAGTELKRASHDLARVATPESHSPIKAFWHKYPLPFILMVCFAFISGGGAALLMSTGQKPTQPADQGKQQEAETYLRDMNEAQRAFYSQNNRFAATLEELERSANMFSRVYYYTYKLQAHGQANAKITAVPKEPGLKSYVGAVFANAAQVTSVVCQTQAPVEMTLPLPTFTNNQPQCPEGTTTLP